jgi:hypothetical protein
VGSGSGSGKWKFPVFYCINNTGYGAGPSDWSFGVCCCYRRWALACHREWACLLGVVVNSLSVLRRPGRNSGNWTCGGWWLLGPLSSRRCDSYDLCLESMSFLCLTLVSPQISGVVLSRQGISLICCSGFFFLFC